MSNDTSAITQIDLATMNFEVAFQGPKPNSQYAPDMPNHLWIAEQHAEQWRPVAGGTSPMRDDVVGNLDNLTELQQIFNMLFPQLTSELASILKGDTSQISPFNTHLAQLGQQIGYRIDDATKAKSEIDAFYGLIAGDVAAVGGDKQLLQAHSDTSALSGLQSFYTSLSRASSSVLTLRNGLDSIADDLNNMRDDLDRIKAPNALADLYLPVVNAKYQSMITLVNQLSVDE